MISYVLDLPFGKGQKFLSGASGVTGKLISGWGIDGTTYLSDRLPLKLSNSNGHSASPRWDWVSEL